MKNLIETKKTANVAVVITGKLSLEFPSLDNAIRYARTSLTFEGLKKTCILWKGRKISAIRPSCEGCWETTKARPYGMSGIGGKTTTHKKLEEAVLAAGEGCKVYSWREGTHRIEMLIHIA